MPNSFHIVCDEDGTRLDVFLSERLSVTRTKVKEMIEKGHVHVDGRVPKVSQKTKKSMVMEGEIPEEEPITLTPEEIPLDVLFEDEYFLAINKPAGMVVHPSLGHSSGTLVNAILAYLQKQGESFKRSNSGVEKEKEESFLTGARPGIVHRLDKGTTGVILIAKDSKTQEMLSELFKERSMKKTYRAIAEGEAMKDTWVTEGNIGRHPVERKRMAVLKTGGRASETSFKVLRRLQGFTYIEAYPKTGRTHQIRVHLAHSGYPIVGDEMYGRKAKNLTDRPMLHAYRIEFAHPLKKRPVVIEAPLPSDMGEFIEQWGPGKG